MQSDNIVYLDNAATTFPKPEAVYVAADRFYREAGANAGRGHHPMARGARDMIEDTRALVARLLGVPPGGEVIFQPSATHALNVAILGAGLREGHVAYVSPFEHNSVLRPLEHLRRTRGLAVHELPFSARACIPDLPRIRAQFAAAPPDLLAVCQASNVTGALLPVAALARAARAANPDVAIVVDGAQAAGLYELSDAALIDVLVFSGHKSLHGPYGASGFALYRDWRPQPILFGGTGTFSEELAMPVRGPSTFEAGSQNVWAIAGLRAAIEWMEGTGRARIRDHGLRLMRAFAQGIDALPGVRTVEIEGEMTAVLSFAVSGIAPQAIENALGAAGIAVRSGLHCAPWAHRLLGTLAHGGTVRVSPGFFNTPAEIERAVDELSDVTAGAY